MVFVRGALAPPCAAILFRKEGVWGIVRPAKLSCNVYSKSLCHIFPMVRNLARNLDLYRRFISVSGPVKDFAVKIDFSAPVPLVSDWSISERQEAIIMHVA